MDVRDEVSAGWHPAQWTKKKARLIAGGRDGRKNSEQMPGVIDESKKKQARSYGFLTLIKPFVFFIAVAEIGVSFLFRHSASVFVVLRHPFIVLR